MPGALPTLWHVLLLMYLPVAVLMVCVGAWAGEVRCDITPFLWGNGEPPCATTSVTTSPIGFDPRAFESGGTCCEARHCACII